MSQKNNKAYLKYYEAHPENFRDEPVLGACGTVSLKSIEGGESTADDIDRPAEYRRNRWLQYHTDKAKELGYEVDVDQLLGQFPLRGSNFDVW